MTTLIQISPLPSSDTGPSTTDQQGCDQKQEQTCGENGADKDPQPQAQGAHPDQPLFIAQGQPSLLSVPYQYSRKRPEGFLRPQSFPFGDFSYCSQALTALSSWYRRR